MAAITTGCIKLEKKLIALGQQKATGRLVLAQGDRQWTFYFFLGHLLYATGGPHRVRRWERALKLYCPNFSVDANKVSNTNLWEYQVLQEAVLQEQLTLNQAKALLRSILKEVLFSLRNDPDFSIRWIASTRPPSMQISLELPLSTGEVHQILQKVRGMWQQWQGMGLEDICPDRAPVFAEINPYSSASESDTLLKMTQLFNGHNTCWDVAIKRKQPIAVVARSLNHFIEQGKMELRDVPDLLSPAEQLRLVCAAVNPPGPLVACIDPSPTMKRTLESILVPAGYRFVAIQSPLRELSNLVKQRPAFVFMETALPETDGYSLCRFLRKTGIFEKTPIVMIGDREGLKERIRAKLSGACAFQGKSADRKQWLEVVRRYIPLKPHPAVQAPSEGKILYQY
ncbi:response regulator [Oxynema aestuarii]|jgi:chemotaxis family two-component system response regulator PixG|uniref:Protein PatA n=1 Tax=Oxynema aestuarii AP17 TaxID=2064643 RepID=A0A6H1U0S5_9CYAN|nr:response regulator [Oxynema aestuarii]QIZ71219.1 response regulator [Oxynema aestuarii AP17]RMH75012.1 MAG: response regulator [Cyanobacteria bacterium J007]